jgi:photosystem II stability/assembly factor-like uncharacterized protein
MRFAFRLSGMSLTLIALIVSECFPTLARHQRSVAGVAAADQLAPTPSAASARRRAIESFARLPLRFEACGPTAVRSFVARAGDCNIYLTATDAAFGWRSSVGAGRLGCGADLGLPRNAESLIANEQLPGPRRDRAAPRMRLSATSSSPAAPSPAASLQMQLVGASPHARITGEGVPATTTNYLTGNDPREWRMNLPTYARVRAASVYRGIDAIYYGQGEQFEYDFDLAPGADPAAIRLRFSGASRVWLDRAGDLRIETAAGEIYHHRPVAYQEINGSRREVACRFVERQPYEIGFMVGAYNHSRPLVIDPVLELASALQTTDATGVGLDAAGNIYLTGAASSFCFPTTAGVAQSAFAGGNIDAFIAKLDPTGATLLYSTYLGGADEDLAKAIAVDAAGNAYITGRTRSSNFPVTAGALQTAAKMACFGRPMDGFVAKLNPTGTALVYSTYLGGCLDDEATAIIIDAAGNAYVGGLTTSDDFPLRNPMQSRFVGGECVFDDFGTFCADGFVSKLNAVGGALIYSTYIGGHGYDRVNGLALDGAGNLYAAGETTSNDFPVTAGAFQTVYRSDGQFGDAFALKLNATGAALVYSTFLGGGGTDAAHGIAVNDAGEAYITGDTAATDFPITTQALQPRNASASLYKSTNGGNSWSAQGSGLPSAPEMASFVLDPTAPGTLYVGLKTAGHNGGLKGLLYKSTDGGQTWQAILSVLTNIDTLAISAKDPVTVYAATSQFFGESLYKSTDGGAHWTNSPVQSDYPIGQVYALVVDPQNNSTLYAATNGIFGHSIGVIKSTNGGGSWQTVSNGLPSAGDNVTALAIDPNHPATLYANVNGTYRTTDGGLNWMKVDGLASFNSMAISAADSNLIYAATATGVFKTVNGGKKWKRVDSLTLLPFSNVQFDPTTPATVYATTIIGGIFKTTDGGTSWAAINTGFPQGRTFLFGSLLGVDLRNPTTLYARSGAGNDAFVARLNADGGGLIFSTYLGGSDDDAASAITLDHSGNLFVAGATASKDYPLQDAAQTALHTRRASNTDVVVTKLSGDGAALVYSTYLGSGMANAIATDVTGSAYVAGTTFDGSAVVASAALHKFALCLITDFGQYGFVVKVINMPAGLPAPRVLAITPRTGSTLGGTEITITGSGFQPGAIVRVAGVAATNVQVLSATTIKAITPPAGQSLFLDVAVINPDGQSNTLIEAFTYLPPPLIRAATVVGKDLNVFGSNFGSSSVILLNGEPQNTVLRTLETEQFVLVAKKVGKRIKVGDTVTLQIQNADGQISAPFSFTRPPQ